MKNDPNLLMREKSPYLLKHAHNPVNWYPWGEEAFRLATEENKPVFLSIGYSTCHWCHVMERESFADPTVGKLMNDYFISVKVDREERPDIDYAYMSFCRAMTGRGGWPLSILMTSDKKPFFAATYIPRTSSFAGISMLEIIPHVGELWRTGQEEINASAENIFNSVKDFIEGKRPASPQEKPGRAEADAALLTLSKYFDEEHGGFGSKPKFPNEPYLYFLLDYFERTQNEKALAMLDKTLAAMRLGGIYDHLGGGFFRYATDGTWFLPHFEKMLYNQAMLGEIYAKAYHLTRKPEFAATALETLNYLLVEMRSPEGGFYTARDAESNGVEGGYYLWSIQDIGDVLGDEDARKAASVFGVRPDGNYSDEATDKKTGLNIISLDADRERAARLAQIPTDEIPQFLERIKKALLQARTRRPSPFRDEKILADWNGLTISAMINSARILQNPGFEEAATKACGFVLERMRDAKGRLLHAFCDGEARIVGFLDDYAFFIQGLLDLHSAGRQPEHLQTAVELTETMTNLFFDEQNGGFFLSPRDNDDLPLRLKITADGPLPSGMAVAVKNLLRISALTDEQKYADIADKTLRFITPETREHPEDCTAFMLLFR